MIRSYFKTAIRSLLKNKLFSMINILGLAIGMASCFLILQYIQFELSYDNFHINREKLYRVTHETIRASSSNQSATNHPGVGPALQADFPEVLSYTRVLHQSIFMGGIAAWSYRDENDQIKVFNEERGYNVDPSFFSVFSFPLLYGEPESVLIDASSVVISQSVSQKFFGSQNPLGKTLRLNGEQPFTVTGVSYDVPENSHLKFDFLVSYFLRNGWGGGWSDSWDWRWPEYYTYVVLDSGANPNQLESKFPDFARKYLGEIMEETDAEQRLHLQPIGDIHLRSSTLKKESEIRGNERIIYFLAIVAGLILVIAWINFINLSTARSLDRAREVGLRKVVGASRRQLITQFLFESALLNLLAIVVSLVLVIAALPYFINLIGKDTGSGILDLIEQPWFWILSPVVFICGSFMAGLYPAFGLSSFQPASVLKGKFLASKSGTGLRKVFVGFQYLISVALIAGTIIVFQQVSFMQNQELGYQKDQLLVVKSPQVTDSTLHQKLRAFRSELIRNPLILNLSASSEIPGKQIAQQNGVRKIDQTTDLNQLVNYIWTDRNFVDTYDIPLVAGRNFREDERMHGQDSQENPVPLVVNEKVAQSIGYSVVEDAIDKLVYFGLGTRDRVGRIIGVTKNHHQRSLRRGYDPILLFPVPEFRGNFFSLKLTMQDLPQTIGFVEDKFSLIFPGNQFEYFFLDEFFEKQYEADQQFGKVFGLFSAIALIVACLGLFGLSTYMITQRTKEIAVRKVLGATINSMVYLFSRDFVLLILIANLLALPVVYFLADKWLDSFAFRFQMGWIIFVFPGIALLIISITTVGFQTFKIGSMDPIRSLRTE